MIIDKQQPTISTNSQILVLSLVDTASSSSHQKKTFKERINQLKVKIKPSINAHLPSAQYQLENTNHEVKIDPRITNNKMGVISVLSSEVNCGGEETEGNKNYMINSATDYAQSNNILISSQIMQMQAESKEQRGKQNMTLNFEEIEDILFKNYAHDRIKNPNIKATMKSIKDKDKDNTGRKILNIAIDVRQCSARTKTQSNLAGKKCARENKSKQHAQNIIKQVRAKVNVNRK